MLHIQPVARLCHPQKLALPDRAGGEPEGVRRLVLNPPVTTVAIAKELHDLDPVVVLSLHRMFDLLGQVRSGRSLGNGFLLWSGVFSHGLHFSSW